jgi:folate-dependent phosphoribosylglycinamide formyltransferase PurN
MKIIISYTPNPVLIDDFIYEILKRYHKDVVAVLTTDWKSIIKRNFIQKVDHTLTRLLIVGPFEGFKHQFNLIKSRFVEDTRIAEFCKEHNIPTHHAKTINSQEAIDYLNQFEPDLIFNQANHIIKKPILDLPRIGVLSIHGGRLPKYRGSFSPFWQLYNKEKERGIVYTIMDEKLDSGPIVLQELLPIRSQQNVNALIHQKFSWAIDNFGKAINKLDVPNWEEVLEKNDDSQAEIYTFTKFGDALKVRLGFQYKK